MCTVTYIPTAKGTYLTSNRDENVSRSSAIPPQTYSRNGNTLLYPQDVQAAGTWITLKENGDAAVLLNGAFADHIRKPGYRKSRGLVLLDLFEHSHPVEAFAGEDMNGIEPFTLILFVRKKLWECRWDGVNKHALQLDPLKPYIWSSSTLYTDKAARQRKQWFLEWFSSASPVNTQKIVAFHQNAGKDDKWNGLLINRENKMRTVSITSVFSSNDHSTIQYLDLNSNSTVSAAISSPKNRKETRLSRIFWTLKKAKIRLSHWEYWPSWALYGPLLPWWCWLSIRSRSLFFFSAANPGIEHAGFIQDRKSNIYKLIPPQYYPHTILYKAGTPLRLLLKDLDEQKWRLPLIAKPDIGEKGIQVSLIESQEQLKEYAQYTQVDFLLQEFISYPNEAGIFYYRIPGERKGKISGIVGKEMLKVTGDGHSTIEMLLKQNDRFVLQLQALRKIHGAYLQTVPEDGISVTLAPYGNHARGAKFIDLHSHITPQLTEAVDKICQQIPGFFYGRLDIKFSTWEELAEGKNFCIIEVNGAGSEPTHMYDPSHSLFFAWKEIIRHWTLMQRISCANAKKRGLRLMTLREGLRLLKARFGYLKLLKKSYPHRAHEKDAKSDLLQQ